jgi:hypothetical protein
MNEPKFTRALIPQQMEEKYIIIVGSTEVTKNIISCEVPETVS